MLVGVLLLGYVLTDSLTWFVESITVPPEPVVPQASTIYYSDGKTVLARVGVTDRSDVPLDQVSRHLRHAVLAAEDRAFYDHPGVSVRGLGRAVWANLTSGGSEGASTLTQQYVKNAYLTQKQTLDRKSREIVLALKLERRYTKDEVLERYLNTVYFGRGAYGIQAAAAAYFGIPARDLTVEQSAVLAATIKDPTGFDPANDREEAVGRWNWILGAMAEAGWAQVKHGPYPTVLGSTGRPAQLSGAAGLIVDQVEEELKGRGIAPQQLRSGGLRVITTIDVRTQHAVELAATRWLPTGQRAAIVATAAGTGEVRGYYGGSGGSGYFDEADAPHVPGAVFAPVVVAAAVRAGFAPGSTWNGSSPQTFASRGVPLYNQDGAQCEGCPLDTGAHLGLATVLYAVTDRVGAGQVAQLAHDLGVPVTYQGKPSLVDAVGEPTPGKSRAEIGTGRYPVAPTDLADVYATIAAGGRHVDRHFVQSVAAADGSPVLRVGTAARRVALNPDAWTEGVQTARIPYRETRETSDAWAAGYRCGLATVVWMGGADNKALPGGSAETAPPGIWSDVATSQPNCVAPPAPFPRLPRASPGP